MTLAGHVRASLRLVAIILTALAAAVFILVAGVVLFPLPAIGLRVREWTLDTACSLAVRIMAMNLEVIGTPPVAPYFLVANHLGYIDILVIRVTARARFVSKSEIARWPLFGWLASLSGTLFLDRGNKRDLTRINSRLKSVVNADRGVVVFPEGTSTSGAGVLPFHAGLFASPASEEIPVFAAALRYSAPPEVNPANAMCWWGDMTFLDHLYALLGVSTTTARITFAGRVDPTRDRKLLADRARRMVIHAFEPVDGATPA